MATLTTHCEYHRCKGKADQADTYLNVWLCNKHYSYISNLTDDYQATDIDFDALEALVDGEL